MKDCQSNESKVESLKKLHSELEITLENDREEPIQQFITEHMDEFFEYLCFIPKFKFGNEFISDFISVTAARNNMLLKTITLIELEPSTAQIFNKDGTYSKRLNGAIKQIDDWINWIDKNREYFIASVAKSLDSKPNRWFSIEALRESKFYFRSKIIIGRRNSLTKEDEERRATIYANSNLKLQILTYDMFLDIIQDKIKHIQNE